MQNTTVFSLPFLAPVDWYLAYVRVEKPVLELYDTLPRQSIHSRCLIDGPQKIVRLSVPVMDKGKVITRDARISYRERWMDEHLNSLRTAYRSSPFYAYLEDDLADIFHRRYSFLADLNIALHRQILQWLRLPKTPLTFTQEWEKDYPNDLRNRPKNEPFAHINVPQYPRQFQQNQEVLSIIDFLANEGGVW